jgi:hypothetical protein
MTLPVIAITCHTAVSGVSSPAKHRGGLSSSIMRVMSCPVTLLRARRRCFTTALLQAVSCTHTDWTYSGVV